MVKKPVAIVGAEWDVVDLIESCPEFELLGFFEASPRIAAGEFRHLGPDEAWAALAAETPGLKVALALDSPSARARLYPHYGSGAIISLRSPDAYISPRASIGHGSILQRGVTVMPNARIGTACKLNINSTVHHDATIGDFCTLAPGSQVLGNVTIETQAYVGAGAVIRQHCRIGTGAFIGAGAVVLGEVPAGATVVGVPAKRRLK